MTVNSWLIGVVSYVLLFVIAHDAKGTYLEYAQAPVYLLLTLTLGILVINRFVRDVLLEVSSLMFVVFFVFRIPFVYGDSAVSDVYDRGVDIAAVPHALYVLAYQYAVLSICLLLIRPSRRRAATRPLTDGELSGILKFSGVVLAVNVWYLVGFWVWGANTLPSVISIPLSLFSYTSVLYLLAPALLLVDGSVARRLRGMLLAEVCVVALCVLFTGSKSGVFQVILFYLIAFLVVRGPSHVISIRASLIALAVGVIAGAFFFVGLGFNLYQRGQIELSEVVTVFTRLTQDASIAVGAISYRIGYLDFYIDKVTNGVYASSFSLSSYFRAVVDAITPGFDVFGQPLVSRSVFNVMFGGSEGPNSEAVTVFAEAHRLAGYYSFLIYLAVVVTIRLAARLLSSNSYLARILIANFVAFTFQQYLSGMGLDYWLFGSVLYPAIFFTVALAYLAKVGLLERGARDSLPS